jgi:two-component system, cell cycle sensor histidine kinase and response regulator CckA
MQNVKENIIETLIVLNPDSKIRTVHKATCELLGYKEEELIGNPVHVVFPATEETLNERKLDELIKGDELKNYETYLKTKDGKKIPILFNGSVMKDKEGNIDCIVCTTRETNGHRLVEEASRRSEERYRTILDSIQDGYFEVDLAGNFTFVNDAACRNLGYSRDELIGMNNRQYTDKENAKKVFQAFTELYKTGEPIKALDYEIIRKDGTNAFTEISVSLVRNSEGKPIGFRGVNRNVTERKRAEEALKKSEEEAKRLAQENATMAEIGRIISSTLNIEEVYERFAEEVRRVLPFDRVSVNTMNPDRTSITIAYAFGIKVGPIQVGDALPLDDPFKENIVNRRSSVLNQTEDESELAKGYPNLVPHFRAGLRSMMTVPLISKDEVIGILHIQSLKPNAYTESDVRLAERVGNEIAGAIANAQLFAERKQAEEGKALLQEQLRQSQKMESIGQLAGGVAHDFNNILTVIHGYSELVINSLDPTNPIREDVKEIKAAAERASGLTRQLLAFSRKQVLQPKVIDLNALVSNMVKMLRRMISEGIELNTLWADDLGRVKADQGQIEQVMLNLAVNARDAMPNGGKLTIETADVELDQDYADLHLSVVPGSYVMLSVSDTGVGMTPEVRERVLEPFFTTKEKGKGTGLGLSTVYGIVKQSGGNIWIYSEPGQGSTFKIYLPRVEEEVDSMLQSSVVGNKPQQGSETILLVEDEKMVRNLALTILKRQGYNVLEAEDGEMALRIVQKHNGNPIHLVLTDVVMPGMSGHELSDHLKAQCPEMKVIFMSGYTDESIIEKHGLMAPGINFIQKPFQPDALVRKIRSVLDRPRPRQGQQVPKS